MRGSLAPLLHRHDGLLTRTQALQAVTARSLERAIAAGRLTRPLPGVYVEAARADDAGVRRRAALAYAPDGALSHTTALRLWGLHPGDTPDPVHVTVPRGRQPRSRRGYRFHRRCGFTAAPPQAVVRDGLPRVRLERALVESWPLMDAYAARAAVLAAVGDRRTTPLRLREEARAIPNVPGAAPLDVLLGLLEDGCRSPLEIWGCVAVFRHADLPEPRRQAPVRLGSRTVYLDMLYEEARVGVELDGASHHTAEADRERDLRRDAALATLGITVLRYSPRRLFREPEAVRREVAAVLDVRRRQLGRASSGADDQA